jgi:beta-D-xylosidase 4
MPRIESPAGTTLLNQRFTTPIDRFHIPSFKFSEACHGILSGCLRGTADSTGCPSSFPMPIGQAASFNETLWINIATAISDEARALQNGGVTGVNFFAPNVNVSK